METKTHEDVVPSQERQHQGAVRGLAEGLVPNAVIFIILCASSWVEDHLGWLALALLYVARP